MCKVGRYSVFAVFLGAFLLFESCTSGSKLSKTDFQVPYTRKGLEEKFQASAFVLKESYEVIFSRPNNWESRDVNYILERIDTQGESLESYSWNLSTNPNFSIALQKSLAGTIRISGSNFTQNFSVDKLIADAKAIHCAQENGTVQQNHLAIKREIQVRSSRVLLEQVEVQLLVKDFSLPYAAPLDRLPRPPSYLEEQAIEYPVPFSISEPGLYRITHGEQSQDFYIGGSSFPNLSKATELAEALRFITLNEEYKEIVNAENVKLAIDEFWLEKAGSKERARVLIREYYGRVELSNTFFTDQKPGWMTDRGMIYLVYGRPDAVLNSERGEEWFYENYLGLDLIKFNFVHDNNGYTLERSATFVEHWNKAIRNWRMGHIAKFSL